jgi:diphosphomevalonate decarboxylase
MEDIQHQYVKNILTDVQTRMGSRGEAFAPSNIALCKYWGKRDVALNLPVNSSLSISLGKLGTRTLIKPSDEDVVFLNDERLVSDDPFAVRIGDFLGLFRPFMGGIHLEIRTDNNIPTAAGLASSASGFAALVMALNNFAGWGLSLQQLSLLARLGSGSASRSVFDGFVEWHAGKLSDGMDSFAEQLPHQWAGFCIGILEICDAQKPIGSREGMNRTVETSKLYQAWPEQATEDLQAIRAAIESRDFTLLGKTAEQNALSMHATMLAAWPPLIYFQSKTVEQIHKIQRTRADGLEVYFTIDAGPNIKLLFLEENERAVSAAFPDLQIVKPFG